MRSGHWANNWQACIQDLVAAVGQSELLSLTPAPANPTVQFLFIFAIYAHFTLYCVVYKQGLRVY